MLRLEDNPCVRKQVLSTEQSHWWWHPPENPDCPVWRISNPPCVWQSHTSQAPNTSSLPVFLQGYTSLPTHITSAGFCAQSLSCLGKIKTFQKSWFIASIQFIMITRVKFWLKYPFLAVPFPQNKSLQSCISHRLSLACLRSVSWHGNTVALVHFVKD